VSYDIIVLLTLLVLITPLTDWHIVDALTIKCAKKTQILMPWSQTTTISSVFAKESGAFHKVTRRFLCSSAHRFIPFIL